MFGGRVAHVTSGMRLYADLQLCGANERNDSAHGWTSQHHECMHGPWLYKTHVHVCTYTTQARVSILPLE